MIIFKKALDLQEYLHAQKGAAIGFVPTMGALHAGHISLLKSATADVDLTVCSIFVNPTQFNDPRDFELYPTSTASDISLLLASDCDVLFLPPVAEIYPHGPDMMASYNFGTLEHILEGAHRPGHFRGVGQVVARLLEIVQPRHLYLGRKDYQQCKVIGSLIQMMHRGDDIELHMSPTVREDDGLAMSSRNRRLTEPQRAVAGTIYQCLVSIQGKNGNASFERVRKECAELLTDKGLTPEYIVLADAETLEELADYDGNRKMVALIAARIGGIRLIDNMELA